MSIKSVTLTGALFAIAVGACASVPGGAALAAPVNDIAFAASLSLRVREAPVYAPRQRSGTSVRVRVPVNPGVRVKIGPRF